MVEKVFCKIIDQFTLDLRQPQLYRFFFFHFHKFKLRPYALRSIRCSRETNIEKKQEKENKNQARFSICRRLVLLAMT